MQRFKHSIQKIKSNSGSALITVLIIISLLTILGTGLLMVSVTGLRRSIQLSGANKAFYLSDGAIEESLAEINEMVFEAESIANTHVNNTFELEADEEIFAILDKDKLGADSEIVTIWEPYLRKLQSDLHNEVISEEDAMEYIELGLRCEFLVKYYETILDTSITSKTPLTYQLLSKKGDDYLGSLDDTDAYIKNCINFSDIDAEALNSKFTTNLQTVSIQNYVSSVDGYEGEVVGETTIANPRMSSIVSSFTEEDGISITIKTDGSYNSHNKALELKVKVTEPRYQYVFKTSKGDKDIKENELMNYAITAGKDIVATGGQSNISGNVYAYGTYPESTDRITHNEIGGVTIGYTYDDKDFLNKDLSGFSFVNYLSESGSLTVEGNLFTRSNVKIYANGNDLTVTKNVGANEFRTNKYSAGTSATNVKINGNMYLYEDFVLRGDGVTEMRIGEDGTTDGDLYLILSSEGNEWNSGDHSGAVIIQKNIADKVDINLNQIFISGVAYSGTSRMDTNLDGKKTQKYYKTGESFNVENKYMHFYQDGYAQKHNYMDKIGSVDVVNYYSEFDEHDVPVDDGFTFLEKTDSYDDVDFKANVFMHGATDGNVGTEGMPPTSAEVTDVDKSILKIRSIENDDDLSKNYALGIIIGKNAAGEGKVFNTISPQATLPSKNYTNLQELILNADGRDIDRLMNLMATRNITDEQNDVFKYVTPSTTKQAKLKLDSSSDTRISQMISFPSDKSEEDISYTKNIRIVNGKESRDIYINPPGVVSANDLAIGHATTQTYTELGGIIATKGDVYIYAPLNTTVTFNGLIAAEGRVILYGPGIKNINLDEKLVEYQVAAYTNMGKAFHADEGRSIWNVMGYDTVNTTVQGGFDLTDYTTKKIFSNTEGHTPVIAVVPEGKTINVKLDQPPILVGMQKNKGIRGYEIEYWRETRD